MEAKKDYFMDRLIDKSLTRLFLFADYVCDHILLIESAPAVSTPQPVVPILPAKVSTPSPSTLPPIRFTHNDHVVEGELFT